MPAGEKRFKEKVKNVSPIDESNLEEADVLIRRGAEDSLTSKRECTSVDLFETPKKKAKSETQSFSIGFLHDAEIDMFFKEALKKANMEQIIQLVDSFYFQFLRSKNTKLVQGIEKQIQISKCRFLIMPIHHPRNTTLDLETPHWTFAVSEHASKIIVFVDSLSIAACEADARNLFEQSSFFRSHQFRTPNSQPKQQDGTSCGAFVCKAAEFSINYIKETQKMPLTFSPFNLEQFCLENDLKSKDDTMC